MQYRRDNSVYLEPRCKVCRHPEREQIDIALARRESYASIGKDFDLPYRSLANHRRKHMDFENSTIRRMIDKEAEVAHMIYEFGVEQAIKRRAMLDVCLMAACNALANPTPIDTNLYANCQKLEN